MGSGIWTACSYSDYSTSCGRTYDVVTDRISGHTYTARRLSESLNPKNKIRECCNSSEHPNTVPVILALDVTGSMGSACAETASAISQIMGELYRRFKDVEVMIMGVGDFECDESPLQVSQFESDVRVAKQLDELYIEHGGGGNMYESYTAPWWFGLYRTKLDCFDKQGRKGVIITMGDEPLNPILPESIVDYLGRNIEQRQKYLFETIELFNEASKKFDIFHISVDDKNCCYPRYKMAVDKSFKELLGDNYCISSINGLRDTICDCIEKSINSSNGTTLLADSNLAGNVKTDENGGIVW